MLILNAEEVRRSLPMKTAIEAMKRAYAALSDEKAEVPLRTRLSVPSQEAVSLFMPAYVQTEQGDALGVKVVSLFPNNPARSLAFIQAAVLVLEADTGRPAALLEGGTLTAIRTGAGSGAAIDLLARKDSRVLAVFGAGVQGRTQLEAACSVRAIEQAWVFDPSSEKAQDFAQEMSAVKTVTATISVADSPRQAVAEADIICTATTSDLPVFEDVDVKQGAHISAVGSYTPEMQEVPAKTVARAYVVVDSRSAALAETGDLIRPLRSGLFQEDHVQAEIGEIVLGRKPGRSSLEQLTFFKSVGVAVQDTVAAALALQNALQLGLGTQVPF